MDSEIRHVRLAWAIVAVRLWTQERATRIKFTFTCSLSNEVRGYNLLLLFIILLFVHYYIIKFSLMLISSCNNLLPSQKQCNVFYLAQFVKEVAGILEVEGVAMYLSYLTR